jgi:hypothetical protein
LDKRSSFVDSSVLSKSNISGHLSSNLRVTGGFAGGSGSLSLNRLDVVVLPPVLNFGSTDGETGIGGCF